MNGIFNKVQAIKRRKGKSNSLTVSEVLLLPFLSVNVIGKRFAGGQLRVLPAKCFLLLVHLDARAVVAYCHDVACLLA